MVKKKVFRYLGKTANKLDYYRFRIKQRTGLLGSPKIIPFLSFGNEEEVSLRGQVLEDKGWSEIDEDSTRWKNARALLGSYLGNEAPRVQVRASFQGQHQTVQTDREGYFYLHFPTQNHYFNRTPWHEVKLELLDQLTPDHEVARAKGEVLISPKSNTRGIISDIDDTVLVSHATKFRQKIRLMLFKNSRTRLPFEGVAAFYQALFRGYHQHQFTPIFYVSSSSWKLYELLEEFFAHQEIPKGPLLLRDSRLDEFKFVTSLHKGHKLMQVKRIMETYPNKTFILIGDSGQKDPEIYREIVRRYPGRVDCIYIRDVSRPNRHREIARLALEVKAEGSEMLLVRNTVEAAEHAAVRGFIDENELPYIRGEREKDLQAPPQEQLLPV